MHSMSKREFLAAATGFGAIGLGAALAAEAPGNVGAQNRDSVFNVRDFGAKGDGAGMFLDK